MKPFRVPISKIGRGRKAESCLEDIPLLNHQLDKDQDPGEESKHWWEL